MMVSCLKHFLRKSKENSVLLWASLPRLDTKWLIVVNGLRWFYKTEIECLEKTYILIFETTSSKIIQVQPNLFSNPNRYSSLVNFAISLIPLKTITMDHGEYKK